jgi:hypothetical protein
MRKKWQGILILISLFVFVNPNSISAGFFDSFKPFIDGYEGSNQVSNRWVSAYHKWGTNKSEVEKKSYKGLRFIGTDKIVENVEVFSPVHKKWPGHIYLRFLDGELFFIEYQMRGGRRGVPTPEELVTYKTGDKKLTKIFKMINRDFGQGKSVNSDGIYMDWESETLFLRLTDEGTLFSIYKPIYDRYDALYVAREKEIEKERQLAEQKKHQEEQLKREQEKKLAQQTKRDEEKQRKERERKFRAGQITIPRCYKIPVGIKSYFDNNMKIVGCYRHWSNELWFIWVDENNDNRCDYVTFWIRESGIYVPFEKEEDWLSYAEDYQDRADFLYELSNN